jgi:hypothetical protein
MNHVIRVGRAGMRFLLDAANTGGSMAMSELTVPPAGRVPLPHSHKHFAELNVDGKLVAIGPRDSCFIRGSAAHRFKNPEQSDAKALTVVSPAFISQPGRCDVDRLSGAVANHGLIALPQNAGFGSPQVILRS